MKTKTISLYEHSELSKEAFKKAYENWRDNDFDDYGLRVYLDNLVQELLEKNNIKPAEDTEYAKVYYSLSNCQGDGAIFEGTFDWKKYRVYIKHSGRYYHSHSASIELQEVDNLGFHMDEEDKDVKSFDVIYQAICKELESAGYAYIEDMQSEAAFIESCNANEYTFRENGIMENE